MITMGVDVGSTSSKAIILQDGSEILAKTVVNMGTGTQGPGQATEQALAQAGLCRENIGCMVATGYGRLTFPGADHQVSEVTCHGRGIGFLLPEVRTVIDIGGQDAKALQINSRGKLMNFVMNDKCAAGTGRFLDVMAKVLGVPVEGLGQLSAQSEHPVSISNVCTVFAESEVISHLAAGAKLSDIAAGIHISVARRVAALAMRVGIEGQVAMSGGVALNQGVVRAMEMELKRPVLVHPDAQLAGALGAALLAAERMQ
ncbi:acyl-CoA dehydratase activase [Vermiculatibacterium agrestimuris]|uniref:acyl-CoA dehydratase activase n=1 Tax=Vermiculatibacterium agrestimuris TaxID=2941519 RepID=UPI00203AFF36|nr:acyl-CoA dehydratase activase [Vermiculatibacterium agrestimuris]